MTKASREPLSVDDAAILALESEAIAGHTLKVIVLEPGDEPLSLERLREMVEITRETRQFIVTASDNTCAVVTTRQCSGVLPQHTQSSRQPV